MRELFETLVNVLNSKYNFLHRITFIASLSLMYTDLGCPFNSKNTSLSPEIFLSLLSNITMFNDFPLSKSTFVSRFFKFI